MLSRDENLTLNGRYTLKKLLQAKRRLNTTDVFKKAIRQLWGYRTERVMSAFPERWKDDHNCQRLGLHRKFAELIEPHCDGIASYCHPENKASLDLFEVINTKTQVLQRQSYGCHDDVYFKRKIAVASFLPRFRSATIISTYSFSC